MTERVVITGIGIISPLGSSLQALTEGFAAGAKLVSRAASGEGGAEAATIPMDVVPEGKRSRIGRMDRLCQFLLSASYLAVEAAHLTVKAENSERVGLSFGTGLGCLLTDEEYNRRIVEGGPAAASPRLFAYTVSSAAAGEVSIALGIKGPNVTAHMGLAAGLGAVGYGADLIHLGKADVVLAGGADVVGSALVEGLRDMGLLKTRDEMKPFYHSVRGVCPAEGAMVAVLERSGHARQRAAPRLGCIEGYAAGFEPTLTRSARQSTGVTAAMRRALDLSGRAPSDIGLVFASAHGTPVDNAERIAIAETFGQDGGLLVLAPKAVLGESFGASGALGLGLAVGLFQEPPAFADDLAVAIDGTARSGAEVRRRLEQASAVMVNSLCYSGNVVALVMGREGEA
jgi:3-oxoacyl-[acyl-carrier-protein] synthase II